MRRRRFRWPILGTSVLLMFVAVLGGHSRRLMFAAETMATACDADDDSQRQTPRPRTANPSFCSAQNNKRAADFCEQLPPVWASVAVSLATKGTDRLALLPRWFALPGQLSLQASSVRWQV